MTERALARRYMRESREASTPRRADDGRARSPTCSRASSSRAIGPRDRGPRVGATRCDPHRCAEPDLATGDVVVVGDRPDAQRRAIELGVALLVLATASPPEPEMLELAARARHRGRRLAARHLRLEPHDHARGAVPRADGPEPLTVAATTSSPTSPRRSRTSTTAPRSRSTARGRPVGLVTRSDLVDPEPRRVLLVDHAEQAQSVPGIEEAEIVEILDHHHIGSIETRVPVRATFDPVGSTATLVVERFRQSGMEPSRADGDDAARRGALRHRDPELADDDRARPRVVDYLERVLGARREGVRPRDVRGSSDVSGVPADEIVARDAKEYELGGGETIAIAQIETVGKALLERADELLEALERDARARRATRSPR